MILRISVIRSLLYRKHASANFNFCGRILRSYRQSPWRLTGKASDRAGVTNTVDIDAQEATAIRSVSDIVSRVGQELRIRLLSGRTAILKDDTTARLRFALPRYAGYFRAIHSHVIHQYQYEGEGIYFVVVDATADSACRRQGV